MRLMAAARCARPRAPRRLLLTASAREIPDTPNGENALIHAVKSVLSFLNQK